MGSFTRSPRSQTLNWPALGRSLSAEVYCRGWLLCLCEKEISSIIELIINICWGLFQMLTSVPLWNRDFFNNRINLGYFEQSPSIYLPDSPLEAQRIARGQLGTRFLPQEFILCPAKRGSGPPWWFTVMFTQTQALLSAWGLWWLFVSLLQTQTITLNPNLRIFPGGFACAV